MLDIEKLQAKAERIRNKGFIARHRSNRKYGGKSTIGLLAGLAVGGIVALFTGGIGLAALTAFAVTAQAVQYFLGPKGGIQTPAVSSPQSLSRPTNATGREAAAQQLSLTSASEAIAVPVAFGRVQLSANMLRYDRNTFRSTPIVERTKINNPVVKQNITVQNQSAGGKGGGSNSQEQQPSTGAEANDREEGYSEQVVGFNYFMSFELGLCMGEIDTLHDVRMNPGNDSILESQSASTDSILAVLSGENVGGTVRLFLGNFTQVRQSGEIYTGSGAANKFNNYRWTAFALFPNFQIGTSPSPPSFVFEITRLPQPKDDAGAAITTINARGGSQFTIATIVTNGTKWTVTTTGANTFKQGDEIRIEAVTVAGYDGLLLVDTVTSATVFTIKNTTSLSSASDGTVHHLAYEEANPAAILYEVCTNPIWGRGLSETLMDRASFVTASEYFRDHNIGMSFFLETQDVFGETLDSIRLHVGAVLGWDGLYLYCVNLEDRETAYSTIHVLDAENLNELELSRDTWATTTNELRCEFVNRMNNFANETIPVQDLAARLTSGEVSSKKIALKAFSVRSIAEPQARRILHDMAYPRAQISCRMNDFERRLLPGDFVEIQWKEVDDELTHTFWRVLTVDDSGEHESGFQLVLVEDQYAVPYAGATETFTVPYTITDLVPGLSVGKTYYGDDFSQRVGAGTLTPAEFFQLTAFVTGGADAAMIALNRSNKALIGIDLYWKLQTEDATKYKKIGFLSPWVISGELITGLKHGRNDMDKSATFTFTIDNEAADEYEMLQSANKVDVDADDYSDLMQQNSDIIRIGNECMLVGKIEDTGSSTGGKTIYRARNLVRGMFGTRRIRHLVGDTMVYAAQYSKATHMLERGPIPLWRDLVTDVNEEADIDFKAAPVSARGGYADSEALEFQAHISSRGTQPFAPGLLSCSYDGTTQFTVVVRPRWHNAGAGLFTNIEDDFNQRITEKQDGYSFAYAIQTAELNWIRPAFAGKIQSAADGSNQYGDRAEGFVKSQNVLLTGAVFTADEGEGRADGILTLTIPSGGNNALILWAILNDENNDEVYPLEYVTTIQPLYRDARFPESGTSDIELQDDDFREIPWSATYATSITGSDYPKYDPD